MPHPVRRYLRDISEVLSNVRVLFTPSQPGNLLTFFMYTDWQTSSSTATPLKPKLRCTIATTPATPTSRTGNGSKRATDW